jgi:hypothetical protein
MAYQYLVVCIFDFIIFPIASGLFIIYAKVPYVAWEPITLKQAGLYHMAMAAIVGVSAWTRGQEKLRRIDDDVFTQNEVGMSQSEYDQKKDEVVDPTIVNELDKK